ncbi:hypothetical protein [Brassicibacter mesophilus]|uniref:hypothetical protein n=1 Tax=Brassicibacter mesophilus TaxID=745119 RepID=UPI003D209455
MIIIKNIKFYALIIAGIGLILLSGIILSNDDASVINIINDDFKINDKIELKKFGITGKYILDIKKGDVTGDNVEDTVLLIGDKESKEAIYAENLDILVKDGNTDKYSKLSIKNSGGYKNRLFLGDFNRDKIKDVLLESPTGGSGGFISYGIYSFVDNNPDTIISLEELSRGVEFKGEFIDGFKADINNAETNSTIIIDLSAKKPRYIGDVYDKEGKLLRPVGINASGYQLLRPVDYDKDGTYELEGYTRITGIANSDTVAVMISLRKYQEGKFIINRIKATSYMYIDYK